MSPRLPAKESEGPEKQGFIVDAPKQFKTGRAQSELLPEHVARIYGRVRDYTDVEGIARLVWKWTFLHGLRPA